MDTNFILGLVIAIMNENAKTQRRYGAKNSTTLRDSLAFCAFLVKLEDTIGREIASCAIEAHQTPRGHGLLESVYEETLARELVQHREKCKDHVFLHNKTAENIGVRGRSIKQPLRTSAHSAVKSNGFYTVQHRS